MPSCAHAHWSQLGQGKYLDNASSCGESKAPVYFSSLLLIILLIAPCVLEAQRWLSCSMVLCTGTRAFIAGSGRCSRLR